LEEFTQSTSLGKTAVAIGRKSAPDMLAAGCDDAVTAPPLMQPELQGSLAVAL